MGKGRAARDAENLANLFRNLKKGPEAKPADAGQTETPLSPTAFAGEMRHARTDFRQVFLPRDRQRRIEGAPIRVEPMAKPLPKSIKLGEDAFFQVQTEAGKGDLISRLVYRDELVPPSTDLIPSAYREKEIDLKQVLGLREKRAVPRIEDCNDCEPEEGEICRIGLNSPTDFWQKYEAAAADFGLFFVGKVGYGLFLAHYSEGGCVLSTAVRCFINHANIAEHKTYGADMKFLKLKNPPSENPEATDNQDRQKESAQVTAPPAPPEAKSRNMSYQGVNVALQRFKYVILKKHPDGRLGVDTMGYTKVALNASSVKRGQEVFCLKDDDESSIVRKLYRVIINPFTGKVDAIPTAYRMENERSLIEATPFRYAVETFAECGENNSRAVRAHIEFKDKDWKCVEIMTRQLEKEVRLFGLTITNWNSGSVDLSCVSGSQKQFAISYRLFMERMSRVKELEGQIESTTFFETTYRTVED